MTPRCGNQRVRIKIVNEGDWRTRTFATGRMDFDVAMSLPGMLRIAIRSRASRLAMVAAAAGMLAACQDSGDRFSSARAYKPIPADVVALMRERNTDTHAPILIRAYKKEAEFEIWKQNRAGEYVHIKTYPMCRWSGQLGPKVREGDRQVPEGFYTITPGQMNPNSAYYLSFNVGYPNAYDRAHGYTGGSIMVHGDCSSAGCFSMTDAQIAEIYAIAREAFGGGQKAIQMQSLPFRMTAENLAKHRFDPNMRFWKQIKEGVDAFDVTHRETKVAVCSGKYVFGATPEGATHVDANAACPPMQEDANLKSLVAEKQRRDDAQVAELVAKGVKAVKVVYADGGQHPDFTNHVAETSRPDAIAQGPVEIAIDEKGRPLPENAQVAATRPVKTPAAASAPAVVATSAVAKTQPVAAAPTATTTAFAPAVGAKPAEEAPFYQRWLGLKPVADQQSQQPLIVPVTPEPSNVPTPPKRQAQGQPVKPQAALSGSTKVIAGARAPLPDGFKAYAAINR